MDKATIDELLNFILNSITHIKRRFSTINYADDFLSSDEGIDKLDAISMRLQSIGEALNPEYAVESAQEPCHSRENGNLYFNILSSYGFLLSQE